MVAFRGLAAANMTPIRLAPACNAALTSSTSFIPQVLITSDDDDDDGGVAEFNVEAAGGENNERMVARGSLDFIKVSPTRQQLTPRL
jgi:hypothetical protein